MRDLSDFIREAAEDVGMTPDQFLCRRGQEPLWKKRRRMAAMVAANRAGWPKTRVAEAFRMDRGTVYYAVKVLGE